MLGYCASIGAAHRCRERRMEAMARARAARIYFADLAPAYCVEIVLAWVRIARMESRCARAHFARARAAQLSLLGEIDDAPPLPHRGRALSVDTHRGR